MRRWVTIAVALLVVPLAGCGLAPGQQAVSGPGTVTPASVPTDAPTPTPVDGIAPGVTRSGTVDPVTLADAHRDALMGDSFTRTTARVIIEDGAEVRRTYRTYRASPYRVEFRYTQVQTVSGPYPVRSFADRIDIYSNGSNAAVKLEDGNSTQYRLTPTDQFSSIVVGITGNERISALTSAFDFEVRDGPTPRTVLLVGTTLKTPSALDPPTLTTDVRNATLTVLLSETGLVRSYRLSYDVTLDDRPLTVVETTRITQVGQTDVERPSWFSLAVENGTVEAPDPNRRL